MPANDDYDDDLDDNGTDDPQPDRNPLRAQVRKQERELKALREQLAEGQKATRELAFVKAGVNPQDKKAAYFIKAYDGDLTPDAIKAAALDAGFLEAETGDVIGDDEKAGLAEIERGSSGGRAPGRAEDFGAQMQALAHRRDLTPAQQRAALDALVAQAGIPVAG